MMNEKTIAIIRSDYYTTLADFGITHKMACEQSFNTSDFIDHEIPGVELRKSPIHGMGLFATKSSDTGQKICEARVNGKRTIAGKYANHAPNRNAFVAFGSGDISLYAAQPISCGDEITVNYRESLALQIQKPAEDKDLIAKTKDVGSVNTNRLLMTGTNAVAYDLFFGGDHIANMSKRERVLAFEAVLETQPQVEMKPKHTFIKGLYSREVLFKKGTFATGRIHRDDHLDVVLSGRMIMATDEGFEVAEPGPRISKAGNKKAGYALEDTVWITYHPTSSTTVAEVEKEIFINDFDEIEIQEVA